MPRFRITRPLPQAIQFRNGRLILEARPAVNAYTMFARKDLAPSEWQAVALWSAHDEAQLAHAGRVGVEVRPHSTAERVFAALVALKVAERVE